MERGTFYYICIDLTMTNFYHSTIWWASLFDGTDTLTHGLDQNSVEHMHNSACSTPAQSDLFCEIGMEETSKMVGSQHKYSPRSQGHWKFSNTVT